MCLDPRNEQLTNIHLGVSPGQLDRQWIYCHIAINTPIILDMITNKSDIWNLRLQGVTVYIVEMFNCYSDFWLALCDEKSMSFEVSSLPPCGVQHKQWIWECLNLNEQEHFNK